MRYRYAASAVAFALVLCRAEPVRAQESLSVTRSLVRLVISVGRSTRENWRWNSAETPDGHAEYVWSAQLDGDSTYTFGFMLFKIPGTTPQQGDFAALLRAGQAHVASVVGHREQLLPRVRVTVRGEDSTLVVELRDPAVIAAIFARRPLQVTLLSLSPGTPVSTSRRVSVQYDGF